jgi:predicted flap endonuclease-1-like 5' DNA nuclease
MMQMIEANWLVWGGAVLAILLIAWLLLRRGSKAPQRREYKPDVLDQGAASVHRNQALIDAAPAAQVPPPPLGVGMAGLGEAIAIGAQDVVEEAEARAATSPYPPVEVPEPAQQPEIAPEPEPAPAPEPLPEVAPEPAQPPLAPPEAATPIVPAADLAPQPVSAPEPTPGGSAGDDLARIKGLGPKLQALLPTLGLSTYAQIAALSDGDLIDLDGKLGAFAGRPAKDNWVEQARLLAEGDVSGFEARFGKVSG